MRLAHSIFHHRSFPPPDDSSSRGRFPGTDPFRYFSRLSGPERTQPTAEPVPAPKWLEGSLIAIAISLAAFTVLHQPRSFAPQIHRSPASAVSSAPATAVRAPSPHPIPASTTAALSRPAVPATGFPRDVTIARDLSVTVEYGVVGLRKGQPVQLVDKTDSGYYAVYEDYLLPLKDGDFN